MSVIRAADLELTAADIARAAALYGIERVEPIGGFENVLLRSLEPPGRILRLTHSSRRSVEMVNAEFEYMAHAADHGVPVVDAIRSEAGTLVESIELGSGEMVVAACMTQAPGAIRGRDEWADAEIEAYGAMVGALHIAAEGFQPAGTPRPPWTDAVFDVGIGSDVNDAPLSRRLTEVRAACRSHDAGGTGLLIHQDAHYGNLHLTADGRISLFDFDDCAYGTPTHDVAIVLFYWLMGREEDLVPAARRFTTHFVRGYERRRTLPGDWPAGADRFLTLRELDMYWLIGHEAPTDGSPVEARFINGRRRRILEAVPYLGTPLADLL